MIQRIKYKEIRKTEIITFNTPNSFTRAADINVAETPMNAHSPLKPPIIDGLIPAKHL